MYLWSKEADILLLTETWLTNSLSIPTNYYKYFDILSKKKKGEGLRLIYKSNLTMVKEFQDDYDDDNIIVCRIVV